jgi:serine/threonine-protein kinase
MFSMSHPPSDPLSQLAPTVVLEINRACDRFEAAWRQGHRQKIEDLLVGVEGEARTALARELIVLELACRRGQGERPRPEEYERRFPADASWVEAAFRGEGAKTTRGPRRSLKPRHGATNIGENLLFGILALQNNFIDRTALLAAFNTWVTDKSRPLGSILLEQGALDGECHDLLNALVRRHIKNHDDDPEQSLAALSSVDGAVDALRAIADPDVEASLSFVPSTRRDDPDETVLHSSPPSPGVRYQRVRYHAKGGLGEVYVARDTELNREVALKEIQPVYADEPSSRTRFVVEAEITGGLEHPGIVPVYGLGHYDNGRPFYAMRFIKGDSLKDAIDEFHNAEIPGRDPGERILSLQKLLRRFLDVCDAIDYAHSRGILHRDLKPNNVMVGKYGETLVVDWGLAKSVGRSEGDERIEVTLRPSSASGSAETLPGSVIGTPGYMSPEQAAGRLDLLGPVSDVYSLGATLYALLTGKAPFSARDINLTLQQVQHGEFPRPRQVAGWLDPALEAVCLKAMALQPDDRYRSPRALASDIERWIADEPVSVRREPFPERARRWVKRNRTMVAGLAAALVASVVGLSALAAQQSWANQKLKEANTATTKAKNQAEVALAETREAKKATDAALANTREAKKATEEALGQSEAVSKFLFASFRSPDPSLDGEKIRVAEVLDRAVDSLDKEFTGAEATRGAMLNALGETYLGLGLYEKAVATHAKARAVREAANGPDHLNTLQSRNNLARAYVAAGRTSDAIRMHEETLKQFESKLGPDHPDTLNSRNNLAAAYTRAGRANDAIRLHEETLKRRESILGPDHPDTLISRNNLAEAYNHAGRANDAIRMHEETLKQFESKLSPDHPNTHHSRNNLANTYSAAGRTSEAIRMNEETLKRRESILGPDHPDTLNSRNNLASTYFTAGRTSDAIRIFEETLKLSESKLGPDHPNTLSCMSNLAVAYNRAGRANDAIRLHEETLKRRESILGPDHPNTLISRNCLASTYFTAGRTSDAIRIFEETLKLSESKLGPDHPDTLISRNNLAVAYSDTGRTDEAIRIHEETLKLCESKLGPNHPSTLTSRNNLTEAYLSVGRTSDAIRIIEEMLRLSESRLSPDHPDTLTSMNNLTNTYRVAGRTSNAIRVIEKMLKLSESKLGPDHPDTLIIRNNVANAYESIDRWTEAEPLRRDTLAHRRKTEKPESPLLAFDLAGLGHNLLNQSNWSEAESALRECLEIRGKVVPDDWSRFNAMNMLGGALLGQGKYAEAEPLVVPGYEGMKAREAKIPPQGKPSLTQAAERVVRLYEAWGKPEEADAWKGRLGLADLPSDVFARP